MMRTLCRAFLRLTGWKLGDGPPDVPKCVVIAAPHTSNWDLVFMLAMAGAFGIRVSWMGKDAIFRAPFGSLMRWLGGIPVRRHAAHNVVAQMVEAFAATDRLLLAVPPEGTRSRAEYWKSGFYHIARCADVPVAPSYLDYGHKVGGFAPAIRLTGDLSADMDRVRAVYAGVTGKRPSQQGPIRLREEASAEPLR
jgi:1-acyl-sn-glycerol-3-phosphate acyltransferase